MAADPRFPSYPPLSFCYLLPAAVDPADGDDADVEADDETETRWRMPDELPMGFRFWPSDRELVEDYLVNKVLERPHRWDFIRDFNLYECDAPDLPRLLQYNDYRSYYYVRPTRKYPRGSRPNRSTPGGYWKATGRDAKVRDAAGVLIGSRKSLVFYTGKQPAGDKTDWNMKEYRLNPELEKFKNHKHPEMGEYVLCKVYDRAKAPKEGGKNEE